MQQESDAFPKRLLDTLSSHLINFNESGGDTKQAKLFNNVIHERLFNVEIEQVSSAKVLLNFHMLLIIKGLIRSEEGF